MSLSQTFTLNDGNKIPMIGFGTYENDDPYEAVKNSLECGYRLIDTAEWYENEEGCGKAIRDFMNETKTPRSEIFYTTKLMANNGFEHTRKAIKKSLELSGLDYIDLYLIHGPYPDRDGRLQAWKAIEEAIDQGIIKSAGVSNYAIRHLEELYETNPKYRPTVNQIDVHPFMTRAEEVEFNRQHNVLIEAWGPLARAMRFDNPTLASIAKTHNKSPAQVLLRWSIQNGFIPLPKSVKKERLISNSQVFDFDLSKDEMDKLSQLDEYLVTDWDPIGDKSV